MDNQFPAANSLNQNEQLRQMQNLAALLAQYFTPGALPVNNNFAGLPGAPATPNNSTSNNAAPTQPPPTQQPPAPASGGPSAGGPSAGPGSSNHNPAADRIQLQQTIRLLKQQQQRQQQRQQQQQQQQHQQQQQQMSQEFTQRLQQQLQQIVQQQQRQQQPQPSHSQAGEPGVSLTIRQQQSLQNSLPASALLDQAKRKRGRPPLSKPGTSGSGAPVVDYNYLNMFAAVKSQQDREKIQRENKLLQEKQREFRKQQELERQRELRLAQERERQRELRLQQERERQRQEMERQRKAHHVMAIQDIERERRRQHMIMLRNLDAYKKNVEKEKLVNEAIAERNKITERRVYQKRLEVELGKEIRKPIDDMMLKNLKPLATLNRIPGLKLPGKAFSDLLMSYEFIYNFGETINLEAKTIPVINTLQLGLLNLNTWAEDQLISLMHHLCMFAIKDPRFPYTGSTKEIETLESSNEGLSQLLHFYLQVLTLNAKTEMEHEVRLYKLIEQKYFLSLNATQKAEMLAFICNELLCSQTVTKHMEDTIENVAKLRKDKWVLENELRKFRAIKTKRELKEEAELKAKEEAAASNTNGETHSIKDEEINDSNENNKLPVKKESEDKNKTSLTNGSSATDNNASKKENDTDTSTPQQNNTNDLDDLEPGMTNDELNKKIDNLMRQYNKTSNKLERAIYSMRASPLGQDRYRRRYWVLPQVGGVFVEGMESSEPEELENNKFTEEELEEYEKEQQALLELAKAEESAEAQKNESEGNEVKEEKVDEEMDGIKEDGEEKDEDDTIEGKDEEMVDASEVKEETKAENLENGESEGEKNSVEAAMEDPNSAPVPKLWFSILPRDSCDFSESQENIDMNGGEEVHKRTHDEDGLEVKAELTDEELKAMRHEICPALAKRLEELEKEQYETSRKIHPQFQYGWWRITDAQQLKAILNVLNERGTRERILHKHLTKHFQYACNSCKNTTVDFEITSFDRQLAGKNYGAPLPHTDDDSADDLRDGEEEEEEDEEEAADDYDEDTGGEKSIQQPAVVPAKKSKRKKASRSARSRRLRARAAARKKVENSRNRLAQR